MNDSIVFLDRDTLDAGDLDFSPLESLGNLKSYPITAPDETPGR